MKNFKYLLLLLVLGIALTYSCDEDNDQEVYQIEDGVNIVGFQNYKQGFPALANGDEYTKEVFVKITGPSMDMITEDITITVAGASSSTAIENKHYRFVNPTLTLTKSNNYLGIIQIILMTEGNTPPMDGTPEFDAYKSPILDLEITSATGNSNVVATGRPAKISLNFTPPNPYAGDYASVVRYFHPTAGGSYPDDPFGGVRNYDKTLVAVTGRKCQAGFAVWQDYGEICWITVNADNSITYEVHDGWNYDVALGDPNDPTKVSYYDPDTGIIYLYYHYYGTGGPRIFWEVLTPKF